MIKAIRIINEYSYLALALIQILLVLLKVYEVIDWSWWFVMIPLFTIPLLMLLLWLVVFFVVFFKNQYTAYRNQMIVRKIKNLNRDLEAFLKEHEN